MLEDIWFWLGLILIVAGELMLVAGETVIHWALR